MSLARAYDLIIVDLDGVIYLGDEAVPGAATAIRTAAEAGSAFAYATNNASRRPDEVAALLRSLGVPAETNQVFTSALVAAHVLAADLSPGARVLVVGSVALRSEIESVGLTPVASAADRPLAVVQGYGPRRGLGRSGRGLRRDPRWRPVDRHQHRCDPAVATRTATR